VVVAKPVRVSMRTTEAFIHGRRAWIEETKAKFERRLKRQETQRVKLGLSKPEALPKPRKGSKAYEEGRAMARAIARERLLHFNQHYRVRYGTLSIRNQKTRWGSCSAQGNLSFNYLLAYLPSVLQDYLIVHELCHTKEHNHSPRFWALVAQTIPDHARRRKQLHLYDLG
jgi:predicted metal-dependent hydrolase